MYFSKHLINKTIPRFAYLAPTAIILCCLIFLLGKNVSEKNRLILKLSSENKLLSAQVETLNNSLNELHQNHSDIRLLNKQALKLIKWIDQSAPIAMYRKHSPIDSQDLSDEIDTIDLSLNSDAVLVSSNELKTESWQILLAANYLQTALKQTPSLLPSDGYISSKFGVRIDPFTHRVKTHNGLDIASMYQNPVFAPADGIVQMSQYNESMGNLIVINHDSGIKTRYGHLSERLVVRGQKVSRGDIIGRVGDTGSRCQGTHLHYEVHKDHEAQDPAQYLLIRPDDQEFVF